MALIKKIIAKNGLPLEYHRIALITIEPNQQITILRHSYLNEEARQYEKDYALGKIESDPTFPYVDTEYVHASYSENIKDMLENVMSGAYALLKKYLPELEDAEDDL